MLDRRTFLKASGFTALASAAAAMIAGMGVVIAYAGVKDTRRWASPKPAKWAYAPFGLLVSGTAFSMETITPKFAVQLGMGSRLRQLHMDSGVMALFDCR